MNRESEIKLIAYSLWEKEGCPDGHDVEHWLRAETIWEESHNPAVVSIATRTKSNQVLSKTKSENSPRKPKKANSGQISKPENRKSRN